MSAVPALNYWNPQPAAAAGSAKRGIAEEDAGRLKSAAKDFEALFLNHMLSIMRETVRDSGLMGNGLGQGTFTELFDQEVARKLADRGALGIADLLLRGLADPLGENGAGGETGSESPLPTVPPTRR